MAAREGERVRGGGGGGRGGERERGRGDSKRKGVARRDGSQYDHTVTPGPHAVTSLCEPAFLTRSSHFFLHIRRQMEKVSCLLMTPPAKRRMTRRADANATNASNGTSYWLLFAGSKLLVYSALSY